jgi:DNA-binding response OmpR family regulator
MAPEHELRFRLFRLDMASEHLWRAAQELRLRPKSFAVLAYLVQRLHAWLAQA